MAGGKSAYQEHDRRFRQRWFVHPSHNQVSRVEIPDDITILTRDPSPCFMCGDRGACRHRPWERDLIEQSA